MVRRRTNGLCSGPAARHGNYEKRENINKINFSQKYLQKNIKGSPFVNEKMYYVVLSLWLKLALFSIQIMLTADINTCSEKEIFIGIGFAPLKELTI